MISLALLPVGLSVLLAFGGPRLARRIPGRSATLLLTVGALASALSVGLVLCAIGCLAMAQWGPFASLGHWSPAAVTSRDPLPDGVDLACGMVAIALVLASVTHFLILSRRLVWSATMCRRLGEEHAGELVVLDAEHAEAYALAGLPGMTVVTRPMLSALSGVERRALLAHERSHVAGYHFAYVNLVQLSATANPLLRPLVPAVRLAVERWADDDAAAAVTDRRIVATSLARAGLARVGGRLPAGALGAAASDLETRLDSLVSPRFGRQQTLIGVAGVVVVAVGCTVSSALLGIHLNGIVEWAQTIGRHR